MARPGNNKKRCEKYQRSGHLEQNKKLRAERHKKRMERFAARRENGEAYKYEPNPYEKGTPEYNREAIIRSRNNLPYAHKTEYQRITSLSAKLEHEQELLKKQQKVSEKNGKGTRHPSPQEDQ